MSGKLLVRGVAVLSAVAAICFEAHLNSGAASLVILVTLAFHSLDTGFAEAAILSAFAVGVVDFFFIDPLFSFTVSDPADAIALLCFLLTSLVITRIQAQTRLQRSNAEGLYLVSQSLIALPSEENLGKEFLDSICAAFGCDAVSLYDGRLWSAGTHNQALDRETQNCFTSGVDHLGGQAELVTVCLKARGHVIGAVGFSGLKSNAVAPSLAALAATGLDRADAFRRARTQALNAEAEVLRSAILDALAHEFKVPLATIMTAAGGLSATGSLNEKQMELANLVESESERLSELSTRLLRLARLDRDQVSPQMETADLAALTEAAIRRQRFIWPDRAIDSRSAASPPLVMADPELIRLVLTQLLDNACRYAKPGSHIQVNTGNFADTAFVEIQNDGPGIPEDEHERVFDRFFRGEQARQSASGSGLGLYVARKIAVAHSGKLALVPTGSDCVIFRLELPCHVE